MTEVADVAEVTKIGKVPEMAKLAKEAQTAKVTKMAQVAKMVQVDVHGILLQGKSRDGIIGQFDTTETTTVQRRGSTSRYICYVRPKY